MKKDKNEIVKEAVENLMDMFKSGKMPEKIAFSIIHRHDGDIIPSDRWSVGNRVLSLLQGTTDARGYKQWLEAGRHVKKGCRAIYIMAPLTRKIAENDKLTGEAKDKVIITGFRPLPVYRFEDTEGAALPYDHAYEPKQYPPFFDVAKKLGIDVSYRPMAANYLGKFSLHTNKIQLCAHDAVVYYHELAHAVHSTFVDLRVYDSQKAEIVAEFSACVLAEISSIHGYESQGYEYILHYCKNDEKKPEGVLKKIMSVLTDVDRIVTTVLEAADEEVLEPAAAV